VYTLIIANKNYSSWSLRPWLLMKTLQLPFEERLLPFHDAAAWDEFARITPARKVPCLLDESRVIWDSLSIVEYLAERHPEVWPTDDTARAWARSAAAEMHSSFTALRTHCTMNCGVRVRLHAMPAALEKDIQRFSALWAEGLDRFGGPFLAGPAFTAVDAFFAPVAFRIQTYGLKVDPEADAYAARLRALPFMLDWYAAGLEEPWRDASHDEEMMQAGVLLEDLRAPAIAP
jgi:glutathione S-transferase